MSSPIKLSRNALPANKRAELAIASVIAAGMGADNAPNSFAPQVYKHLIELAIAGGFKDADILTMCCKRARWGALTKSLAADLVEYVGGPNAVLDIFDLHTFDETTEELPQ